MNVPKEFDAEILRHIDCGAPGTPHLEAGYHRDGHDITERVRIRVLPLKDEITDDMVKKAATAIQANDAFSDQYIFDDYVSMARSALTAALGGEQQ